MDNQHIPPQAPQSPPETTPASNPKPDYSFPAQLVPPETPNFTYKSTRTIVLKKILRRISLVLLIVVLLGGAGFVWWIKYNNKSTKDNMNIDDTTGSQLNVQTPVTEVAKIEGLQLDTKKNYGDKYASGILPVGDNKYVIQSAKKGAIYVCRANFVAAGQAGAQKRGPWFTGDNTQWDINKKSKIAGDVNWQQQLSIKIVGDKRVVITNDLPSHRTGVFPVGPTDPARIYDANPNTISGQSLTYNLAAAPTYGDPSCVGGEVGVMTTGVALFDGFDAGGRDAGAWEVQDSCDGHPQNKGEYHYHAFSMCISLQGVTDVIGYA